MHLPAMLLIQKDAKIQKFKIIRFIGSHTIHVQMYDVATDLGRLKPSLHQSFPKACINILEYAEKRFFRIHQLAITNLPNFGEIQAR